MMRLIPFVLAAFLITFSSYAAAHHGPGDAKARPAEINRDAPPFRLTAQDGRRVALSDFRGNIVLLSFIYTTCIDLCPFVTADMMSVFRRDRKAGRRNLRFLFIATDPEVDKPRVLLSYAERYGADLSVSTFLTGTEAELRPVWGSYGVKVSKKARGLVEHTMVTVLIDSDGKIRRRYLGGRIELDQVLKDIAMVRAEA